MSVAPMLGMSTANISRHLDNPPALDYGSSVAATGRHKGDIIVGCPSNGTIAQRRQLARAIRSLAQRQLKSYRSGSLRMERTRRICSLEKPTQGSTIKARRRLNRAMAAKRRDGRRNRAEPGGSDNRLAVNEAATVGSQMVFFGEFKANPRTTPWMGCVVS